MLDKFSAKQKRLALLGGLAVALVTIIWLSDDPGEKRASARPVKSEPVRNIIAPENTNEYGIEALEGKVATLVDRIDDLAEGNERVIERTVSRARGNYEEQVRALQNQIEGLTATIEDLKTNGMKAEDTRKGPEKIAAGSSKPSGSSNIAGRTPSAKWDVRIQGDEAQSFFSKKTASEPSANALTTENAANATENAPGRTAGKPEIVVLSEQKEDEDDTDADVEDIVYELPPIPSASMFKATNITGLDVPTSQIAKDNPYPALMRIKDLAILPNRFRADIRECHALFSGYGEISSERAYLRATSISCMRNDGAVLESKLEAYVVGEDGKAGVRGRLVERRGKYIANAAMAGVADGISKVFSSTAVPTIATGTPGDTMAFQRVLSGEAAQSAALNGASSAAEMLANYYIKRAEEISAILEIDAGRKLSFVLIKPLEMKFKVIKAKKSQG